MLGHDAGATHDLLTGTKFAETSYDIVWDAA